MVSSIKPYSICVIDIGSPRLHRLGWSLYDSHLKQCFEGMDLDVLLNQLFITLQHSGLLLGFEAPLFVPTRHEPMQMLKARQGEGRRPWSAGAGAQVLTMNLPIMHYLVNKLTQKMTLDWQITPTLFQANPGQILVFEALVSGQDKGQSHIEDARIMMNYCRQYANQHQLPNTILQEEPNTGYFNLVTATLLSCGYSIAADQLNLPCPIYQPKPHETKT